MPLPLPFSARSSRIRLSNRGEIVFSTRSVAGQAGGTFPSPFPSRQPPPGERPGRSALGRGRGSRSFGLALLFLLLLLPIMPASRAFSAEVPRVRIAVLPFDVRGAGVEAEAGEMLADLLTSELDGTGRYEMVERLLIEKVMQELLNQGSDFVDPSTVVALGRQVGAQVVLSGTAFQSGGRLVASGRFLDVETAGVLLSRTVTGPPSSGWVPLARDLAEELKKHEEAKAGELLEKARSAARIGRRARALGGFRRLLAKYPRSSPADDALYAEAKLGFDGDDCNAAARRFDDLMDTFPESPYVEEALFYAAECRFFAAFGKPDDPEDAMRKLREWLQEYPDGGDVREKIPARAKAAAGAREGYERLLDLFPETSLRAKAEDRLEKIDRFLGPRGKE